MTVAPFIDVVYFFRECFPLSSCVFYREKERMYREKEEA